MKIKLLCCALFMGVLSTIQIYSQTIEESFNYESGEINGKGTATYGWGGAWTKSSGIIEVVDGNLGNDTIGNTLQTRPDTVNTYYFRELATKWIDDGNDIWLSFYIKRVPADQLFWGGFSLYNGESEDLFIGSPWQSGFVGFGTGVATVQDTLLNYILVKLKMNGSGTKDSAFLWVNYFDNSEPVNSTAEEVRLWGTDGFTRIRIGNDKSYSINYDKIRISDTFQANLVNNPVTGISLSPSTLNLNVGTSSFLTASVIPYNATNRTLTYSSSAENIATVSSKGEVIAVGPGKAVIIVKTTDGSKTASCEVTVISNVDNNAYTATVSDNDQQIFKGWGNCPIWIDNHDISAKPLSQEAAFNMGANIIRLSQLPNTGDGDGNINNEGADKLCRSIEVTTNSNLPYLLVSWSPPADMKTIAVNGSLSGNTLVYLREDKEQTYCDFIVKLLNYISITKSLPLPVAYSFQNEPLNQTIWQGCIYGAVQYQRVFKLLRATLNMAGYSNILLLGPENGYDGSVFLGGSGFAALKDNDYNNAIGAFSTHSYIWESMNINFAQWNNGCAVWGKDVWQTEYCYIDGGTSTNSISVGTTRRLIADMAYFKNNYWFTWTVSDGYGNEESDALCFGDGVNYLTKKPEYFVLKKIFTSVPLGSKVRRMTSTDKALVTTNAIRMDMVAFVSDSNMVVLIVNPTLLTKTTNVTGLLGTSAKVYQMAKTDYNTDLELVSTHAILENSISNLSLPANSVTVITISGVNTKVENLKQSNNLLEIYPNPVTDGVINFKLTDTENNKNLAITITDLQGKLIYRKDLKNETQLNISDKLISGVYIIKAQNENAIKTQKLIVK